MKGSVSLVLVMLLLLLPHQTSAQDQSSNCDSATVRQIIASSQALLDTVGENLFTREIQTLLNQLSEVKSTLGALGTNCFELPSASEAAPTALRALLCTVSTVSESGLYNTPSISQPLADHLPASTTLNVRSTQRAAINSALWFFVDVQTTEGMIEGWLPSNTVTQITHCPPLP